MQNCPLLNVCKKEPIQISWKGNEECFSKNRNNLNLAFGGGSLSWKRDGQKGTYPLHIRYKPKFIPFTEKLVCKDIRSSSNNDGAFLHLFFACPLNAEDYRYNIRPIASDWFAKVNESSNVQWLIVFDSSRAKEKKIRNVIWDRLRSDFAKHINRLIEINDSSSATEKNAFFSVIQSTLINAFDIFVNNLQSSMQRLKSSDDNTPHFLPKIVNLNCKLSLFYWNLGLIENALHELDDADLFLTLIFSRCQNNDLKGRAVKRLSSFGSTCLYLGTLMRRNAVDESTASVAELRAFVLAHQILLTFHMFHQRYVVMVGSGYDAVTLLFGENLVESSEVLKRDCDVNEPQENGNSGTTTTKDEELIESTNEMAFQLCQNFVAFVWRYTHDASCHLIEDLAAVKDSYSPTMLHILILTWYDEIAACCKPLGELCQMENASYFICQMTFLQYDSLKKLLPVLTDPKTHFNEVTVARQWFDKAAVGDGCEPSTSTFAELNASLFSGHSTSGGGFPASVRRRWAEAQIVFRRFGYARHLEALNNDVIALARESDKRVAFDSALENYRLSLSGKSIYSTAHWASLLINDFGEFLKDDFSLLFDCHFVLTLDSPASLPNFIEVVSSSTTKQSRFNLSWRFSHEFPWRIIAVANSLIRCDFRKKMRLKLKIESPLLPKSASLLDAIAVRAAFRPLSAERLRSAQLLFNCSTASTADQKKIQRFTCVSSGSIFPFPTESGSVEPGEPPAFHLNTISELRLSEHVVELEFEGEASEPGCFALDGLVIIFHEQCVFHLDYGVELRRNDELTAVLCFVNTKLPKVTLPDYDQSQSCLLAGVAQKLAIELSAGTLATEAPTELIASFIGTKPLMQFLSHDGMNWCKMATIEIPQLRSEETLRQDAVFCLDIDRMNFSADQSLLLRYDLKVEWLERTWFFALNFLPIISLKSMTSQLGDRVLFEVDLQRCDATKSLRILPEAATLLQDQSVAKSPVEATLLNPTPFEPILANSSYRFVWQLPSSKISKSIPITHFIKLAYSVAIDEDSDPASSSQFMPPRPAIERQYLFENKLTFAVQKVEYEVCAHVLSERPQLVLCRVDVPCDLIVSLRSLTSGVPESIIVVVEVDPQFWTAVDKFKVVHIKGSGIGQTSFTIIPNRVGYLPYPNIFVHCHVNANQNDRYSFNETTFIGERLNSFHRNQGKQIHVLAHLPASEDTSSVGSVNTLNSTGAKKSLKSQAKDKIQKLFEVRD